VKEQTKWSRRTQERKLAHSALLISYPAFHHLLSHAFLP
jgi:hypothetical protein